MNAVVIWNYANPSCGVRYYTRDLKGTWRCGVSIMHNRLTVWQVLNSILLFVILFLAVLGPFIWLFRDGMYPGFVPSTGFEALKRTFMLCYWGPITVLTILVFACCIYRAKRDQAD